jgi:hypothetical protein
MQHEWKGLLAERVQASCLLHGRTGKTEQRLITPVKKKITLAVAWCDHLDLSDVLEVISAQLPLMSTSLVS